MLAEVEQEQVDAIVFGGDLFLGPQPAETAELVRSVDASFVRGNCDREPDDWTRSQLDDETLAWSQGWPLTVELDDVLYCHASPKDDMRPILTEASPPERFDEALEGIDNRLVVAGHTHMQFRRDRWVNAGAVGWPAEDDVAAFWALVSDDVEHRRTPFDVERARRRDPRVRLAGGGVVRRREHPHGPVARRSDRLVRVARVRVRVGKVGKPHGLEGAFFVEEASEDPERFAEGVTLLVDGQPARIVESKRAGGRPVIRLDREVARGAAIEVERDELPEPEEGEYYAFQLVGLEVEEEGGAKLGRVDRGLVRPGERRARARHGPRAAPRRRLRAEGRSRREVESLFNQASRLG